MPLTHSPPYTLLAIDSIDFSDSAVRGITMTLEPIDQAKNVARDCQGNLVDISVAQFQQFKISISCSDFEAPQLAGVWPGQDITITCIPGLGGGDSNAGVMTILAKVTNWDTSKDEWSADIAWKLEAEQRM
jgi:hypothetical protein